MGVAIIARSATRNFLAPLMVTALSVPLLKETVTRSQWAAVLAGGLLFVLMHLPYQMAARGMTLGEFLPQALANVPMQFIWHLVFTWIYRRHGNLAGAVVLHGFVDMSMGLFQ